MSMDGQVLDKYHVGCKQMTKTAIDGFEQLLRTDKPKAAVLLKNSTFETEELSELDYSSIISTIAEFPNMIQRMAEDASDVKSYCAALH